MPVLIVETHGGTHHPHAFIDQPTYDVDQLNAAGRKAADKRVPTWGERHKYGLPLPLSTPTPAQRLAKTAEKSLKKQGL